MILAGCFFGVGRSATLARQWSQYTPAAPFSRTHSPPQCSQYFNSTRTASFPLFFGSPFITPPIDFEIAACPGAPQRRCVVRRPESEKSPALDFRRAETKTQGSFLLRWPAWAI